MKFYLNQFAAFSQNGKKLFDLPQNTVVEKDENGFYYKGRYGDIDPRYVEPYVENYPKDCVYIKDIQTADPDDAQQFINWNGIKQVNMCGEMCVAYILGLSLSDMLSVWQRKSPTLFKRIFGEGKARGTGAEELVEMFNVFGTSAKTLKGRYTPLALKNMDQPIVSCRIDGITGRLRGQGVTHWIVVVDSVMERCGYGSVDIYNPFSNRYEAYDYKAFIESCGSQQYGAICL